MSGATGAMRTALRADEWMPVQESLLQGLVHAANNRVAALSGISQLYEAELSTGDEGMQQLSGEMEKLRALMGLFRLVLTGRAERREPARMGEALQAAAALLTYHLDARQTRFEAPEDAGDVEPVLLWRGDATRMAILALLAASAQAGKATVVSVIAQVGSETVVSVTAPGTPEAVQARAEFVALQGAAEREGGSAQVGAGTTDHVVLTLALPGLRSRALP